MWAVFYLFVQNPVALIIGGVAAGTFLLTVTISVWYLRDRFVPVDLR